MSYGKEGKNLQSGSLSMQVGVKMCVVYCAISNPFQSDLLELTIFKHPFKIKRLEPERF